MKERYKLISIHLMLLFNGSKSRLITLRIAISIHLMLLFNAILQDLGVQITYFNTSNVTIQHIASLFLLLICLHFNTSNVTFQLEGEIAYIRMYLFQYI